MTRGGPRPAPRTGDAGGNPRALIEVLLLHRHLPAPVVVAGMQAALRVKATSPDVVALEARRAASTTQPTTTTTTTTTGTAQVLTLPGAAAAAAVADAPSATVRADLPVDERPLPTVTAYDSLLARRSSLTPERDSL